LKDPVYINSVLKIGFKEIIDECCCRFGKGERMSERGRVVRMVSNSIPAPIPTIDERLYTSPNIWP